MTQIKPIISRSEVYSAIDTERDYQEQGKGNALRHEYMPQMTPGEFLLCMEKVLKDGVDTWYKPDGGKNCLDFVRKVSALGVQCMEAYGAPKRVVA